MWIHYEIFLLIYTPFHYIFNVYGLIYSWQLQQGIYLYTFIAWSTLKLDLTLIFFFLVRIFRFRFSFCGSAIFGENKIIKKNLLWHESSSNFDVKQNHFMANKDTKKSNRSFICWAFNVQCLIDFNSKPPLFQYAHVTIWCCYFARNRKRNIKGERKGGKKLFRIIK